MAVDIELLRAQPPIAASQALLTALAAAMRAAGDDVVETTQYRGGRPLLTLCGVGALAHHAARMAQVAAGGRALLWDLGYTGRLGEGGMMRFSLDVDHPQGLLDRAPYDGGSRWAAQGIGLREEGDPDGPIVLVGMGDKSRRYLGAGWEERTYGQLLRRFPGRAIVYRPKRPTDSVRLPCRRAAGGAIADVLRGASLVVCRHSNVGVDAAIAGIPVQTQDGAAAWLQGRGFTRATRLAFLQRLAWFQWAPAEAPMAWAFIRGLL